MRDGACEFWLNTQVYCRRTLRCAELAESAMYVLWSPLTMCGEGASHYDGQNDERDYDSIEPPLPIVWHSVPLLP